VIRFSETGRDGRLGPPARPVADGCTRLVLVRHGAALCHAERVVGGHAGCRGLSEEGVVQARALAARLARTGELASASHLYSSALARARQTAEILSPALGGLEPVADCGLCELHPGEADGLPWEEVGPRYGEPDFAADPDRPLSPGGESWRQFLGRVRSQLCRLAARHPGQTVVAATHGGVIDGSLVCFLRVPDLGAGLDLRTAHTSITEWQVEGGRFRLGRYNDHAHLAAQQA
jgi:probable phosphoglycerate mutase